MNDCPTNSPAITKVAFVSLGCPKNLIDSEAMLGSLRDSGFELVSDHDEADAIVINTCGFLEIAKEESLDAINEAIERKNAGKIRRIVVAGCLPQRHRAKLLEWAPGIDAMIGVFDRDRIVDAVRDTSCDREGAVDAIAHLPQCWIADSARSEGIGYFEDDSRRFRLTPRHWTYLRISEGCDQRCAFCTIPSIRGKMRSKQPKKIIAEARKLMSDGVFELNLIGQDTTNYGRDIGRAGEGEGLAGLLGALNDVADEFGGAWIRLMYAYPSALNDEMIDAIASLSNIVKYIDIPLQHVSDRMLRAMRRRITHSQQEKLLAKLRDRIEGIAIRTTFITGFPGETDEDHRRLLQFIDDFQFDMLGVFRFSPEDGTPAGAMDSDSALHVPDEVKAQREEELMLTQQRIAFANAAYLAKQRGQLGVLLDGPAGDEASELVFAGRCYHQAPEVDSMTFVHSAEELTPGELVRCTIVDAEGYDLIARPSHRLQGAVP